MSRYNPPGAAPRGSNIRTLPDITIDPVIQQRLNDQERRIDILTRSLEALVENYNAIHQELADLREAGFRTTSVVNEVERKVKKTEESNKKLTQRVDEVEHKASVAYINSTAEDETRQYMYDVRNMDEPETVMTTEDLARLTDRVQSHRGDRRAGSRPKDMRFAKP